MYIRDTTTGNKKYVAVGIVSYGVGCGLQGYPGYFNYINLFIRFCKDMFIFKAFTLALAITLIGF